VHYWVYQGGSSFSFWACTFVGCLMHSCTCKCEYVLCCSNTRMRIWMWSKCTRDIELKWAE
jgi:hypothetical protein